MAYVFKIKLKGSSQPPIWRKIKIHESATFLELHWVIQKTFGWHNSHLHQFSPGGWTGTPILQEDLGIEYFDQEPFSDSETWPHGEYYHCAKIKLNQYFHSPKQMITYIYDFGDDWEHTIELIEITDDKILRPVCLTGKGRTPMEDCGGMWGYYEMVKAINNPKHPEHGEFMEWVDFEKGQKWDVNAFNLEEVQERLRAMRK
ncbi:plasmid pRiA4b ORF-3 family protein [Pricia sp. S334]|uniref:Plasmid pRiA4b ORF-3 family protein n=1 Tax=Pricia mediterranea TaxID=3076079 RepID=A0ABU3L692_9FLAO|nr:plasmid pRiA4b ORF-3 family protein [Pricia sp. S334]MDT7829266.1 plasmid pRiA4b ORF-3 family protein [Pricia sp. S334]